MKKEEARPLNESEREELIRLRAENEYIKAENEVIKKEIALREERHAAQLKAKAAIIKELGEKGYQLKYHNAESMQMARSTYYFELSKADLVAVQKPLLGR